MPFYEYQCVDCGGQDQRVAGLDDHTAICMNCNGLMLRLNEDVFQPYFEEAYPAARLDKASGSDR
ncbi:MAG: zinc ribbon domain-containing protein [Deltaproteobacteria bacterium]|nr:zinc ribbon domain-containing protein [Deltaproteobacteria bacterium]MBM4286117.1 zinc ribbon domain-containing protein [Deltaproteobacteria bacterium]